MIRLFRNKDFYGLSLFVLLFVLVAFQNMVSPFIVVFILTFLIELFFTKNLKFQFSWLSFGFVILFCCYAVSLLWSEHVDIGLKLLEYKLSFIIFPLVFFYRKSETNFWDVINGFLLGCLFFSIALIGINLFVVDSIAIISDKYLTIHPTYSSGYIVIALFILLYGWFEKKINIPIWGVIGVVILGSYLILKLISFASILFFLGAIGFIFILIINKKIGFMYTFFSTLIVCLVSFLVISKLPSLSYDYNTAKTTIFDAYREPERFIECKKDNESGHDLRMMLWMLSSEIIKENPFGVGLGGIDFYIDELVDFYDIKFLKERQLNPHNQYLQIGIDIGVLGIALLLVFLFSLIIYGVNEKKYILIFVVSNLMFNNLFESMLQRQSGIVFFALLICMLLNFEQSFKNKPTA